MAPEHRSSIRCRCGIATLLGFDLGVSVVAVTIDRLISTAITIALGSLASYYLARRLGASPVAEPETEVT